MSIPEISLEQKKSVSNYKRLGIDIEILEDGVVKIKQFRLINGIILNQKELHERAREIFPNQHIVAVVYSLNTKEIDLKWIEDKMNEYGIKRKDLIKQLAFDETTLSLIFLGKRQLNSTEKAVFFYYFLSYELNKGLRNKATFDNLETRNY